MPPLFIFLFKVNIALVLFCLGYYLVLRHLTFYTLNRIYLVIAILFSTLYPNINISGFMQRHQQLSGSMENVILNWKTPAENLVKPLYQPNYWQWVEVIFWAGVILFAARLMLQLFSLYKLYRQSRPGQVHDHAVRLIRDDVSPFSFWRSIYINPSKLSPSELKNVLEHEQVHVSEWHTLDILLAELSTIFYWFNPGVWMMKKAVRENIEFITDRKILRKGMDSKEYQYSLVSIGLAGTPNTLVNHFNMSTIKKRIIMMNTKRSSGYSLTRYLFLVPAVVALLLVFSLSKAATKKGLHTFKAIAADITDISLLNNDRPAVNVIKPHLSLVKEKAEKPAIKKLILKSADTLYSGKSKDGKKSFMMTSDTDPDSVNYVINGVKATKAEVKAIDPTNIYSIEVMSAKAAKEFYPELDNDRQVMFLTTDDSEKGRVLKEKIDKSFKRGMPAGTKNVMITGVGASSDNAPVAVVGSNYSISGSSSTESSDDAPVTVSGSNDLSAATLLLAEPKTAIKVKKFNRVYVTGSPKLTYTISSDSAQHVLAYTINTQPVAKTKNVVFLKGMSNDETTIDSPHPLIIIDGKEAKSLKNIASDDINSITVLKDGSARKLYGDKGKNGVIVIKTKKGK